MLCQVLLAPHAILSPEDHERRGSFPLLASFKLDGNRCLIHHGRLYTRSMKPQPNEALRSLLADAIRWTANNRASIDGELWSPTLEFSQLQSVVRRQWCELGDVRLYAFDLLTTTQGRTFITRNTDLQCEAASWQNVVPLRQYVVGNAHELVALYKRAIDIGLEGLIVRDPSGLYKDGRATVNEGIIFKLKPNETLDAMVVGFNEQMSIHEDAPRHTDERGYLARTSRADHLAPAGTMGSLRVQDEQNREFNIGWGPGWTHYKRQELWDRRFELPGQWVEVRFMPHGEKDLPRMPQLLRFRESK